MYGILSPFLLPETVTAGWGIPARTRHFRSPPINTDSKTPFKIYIAFVEADAYYADPYKNPFDLRYTCSARHG